MGTVVESWNRIHAWMATHQPRMLDLLCEGASENDIKDLEDVLEVENLPTSFKDCYRIHDGAIPFFFFGGSNISSFFNIGEIMNQWVAYREVHSNVNNVYYAPSNLTYDEIKTKIWTKGWIPFGIDIHGKFLCMDLEPTTYGTYSQVIRWTDCNVNPYAEMESDTFELFLQQFANEVENGRYVLSADNSNMIFTADV